MNGRHWPRLVLAVLLLTAACGTDRPKEPAAERTTDLRIPILPFFSFGSFHVAKAAGYLAEQGFKVEQIETTQDAETLPLLVNGKVDAAAFLVNSGVLNAIQRSGDLKIVADFGHADPDGCAYSGLVARPELIESGELDRDGGLDGKRISFTPEAFEGYIVDKVLEETASDFEKLEVKDVPPPVYSSAFSEETLDVAHTSEPWVTRVKDDASLWKATKDVVPNAQTSVLVYGPTFLKKDPDAGKRFMVAYMKGARDLREGKSDRVVNILSRATDLEPRLVRSLCWGARRPDGKINVASVLDFQRWAKDRGFLDEVVPEEDFWEPSFVEYATEQLESEPANP